MYLNSSWNRTEKTRPKASLSCSCTTAVYRMEENSSARSQKNALRRRQEGDNVLWRVAVIEHGSPGQGLDLKNVCLKTP